MIKFIDGSEKLSSREVDYWKKVFNSNLLFASEVEFECESGDFSVSKCAREIEARGNVNYYGNGVETVKSDGSLRNGAEILTPPRRIYSLIQMVSGYKSLIDKLYAYDVSIKARAGWHNHVSLMNISNVKANEMNIPSIILTNLLSLLKLYYPSLAYFTSTLPESEGGLTRYNDFCLHSDLMSFDSTEDIREVVSNMVEDTRYQAINMNRLSFINSDEIERFHIEFRFPDCSLFPVQMASFNILIKSLIMKAIELSYYGVIDTTIENGSYLETLYKFKNQHNSDRRDDDCFINKPRSSDRLSAMLKDTYMEKIKHMGVELFELLLDEIVKIDEDSVGFIKDLFIEPISMKFRGMNTSKVEVINEYYEEILDQMYSKDDTSIEEICKIISFGLIKGVDRNKWKEMLGEMANCKGEVDEILSKINNIRPLLYSKELGYYFK